MPNNDDKQIRIEYKDSYVAFLDVLGFKKLVMDNNQDKLEKYIEVVEDMIEELKKIPLKKI